MLWCLEQCRYIGLAHAHNILLYHVVVVVVLTLTRIIKSVVPGQIPVTLKLRNNPGKKHKQTKACMYVVLSVTHKKNTSTAAKHQPDISYSNRAALAAAAAAAAAHGQSRAEQDLPRFRHAFLIFLSS